MLSILFRNSYAIDLMSKNYDQSKIENTGPSEEELIDDVKNWINSVINKPSIIKQCYGPDEFSIREKELLVRPIPCHEQGAIKR